jgi:hypothetical protein
MPFTRPLYVPSFLKKLPQAFGLRTEFAKQTRSAEVSTCGLPKGESLYAEFLEGTRTFGCCRTRSANLPVFDYQTCPCRECRPSRTVS